MIGNKLAWIGDDCLHIQIQNPSNRADYFECNTAWANYGSHSDLPFVYSHKSKWIWFIPVDSIPVNIDGELHPNSLYEISISPKKFKVMGFVYDW